MSTFNTLSTALLAGVMTLASAAPAYADQLSDIKAKGTLVCGTLGTAEPFSFPNPQTREIQGYDVDFCSALAKSLPTPSSVTLHVDTSSRTAAPSGSLRHWLDLTGVPSRWKS